VKIMSALSSTRKIMSALSSTRLNVENGISWESRTGVYNATIGIISHLVHQELNISVDNLEILDDVVLLQ